MMRVLSEEQAKIEFTKIKCDDKNSILLDFEDLENVTKNKDLVLMKADECIGKDASYKIISTMISDFERINLSHMNVDAILICFQTHSKNDIKKLYDGVEIIYKKFEHENIDDEPDVIFGLHCDDNLDINYVKATLFFGLSEEQTHKLDSY